MAYDALNRVISRTTPDGSVTVPTYNQAGLLENVHVAVHGAGTPLPLIVNIDYNARGQRLLYEYANPTQASGAVTCRTTYQYDPKTFRIATITTTRVSDSAALQSL